MIEIQRFMNPGIYIPSFFNQVFGLSFIHFTFRIYKNCFFWYSIEKLFHMKNIAIFASGSGTNAERITRYFENHPKVKVDLILSNRADAFVLERAGKLGINSLVFSREEMKNPDKLGKMLTTRNIDLIVLAGFLWLIPSSLIKSFQNRIINIHPALLPKFGGKNMYGMRVHQAVIESGEKVSGITIHYVDEIYDHGKVIHQARCTVEDGDTPEILAEKIHRLEYEHYPAVIERLLSKK